MHTWQWRLVIGVRLVECKCRVGRVSPGMHMVVEVSHGDLGWCLVLLQLQRPGVAAGLHWRWWKQRGW